MLVPVIMGFIMVNAFALSFIFIHKIEENIQPILLNFFRALIAVLIISMIFLIGFNFEELKVLGFKFIIFSGASGICGVVLGDIVFMYSQKKISPPLASTLTSTNPIITMIFAMIFLNTAFNIIFLISTLITGVGIFLIVQVQQKQNGIDKAGLNNNSQNNLDVIPFKEKYSTKDFGIGVMLGLATSFLWAAGNVFYEASINELDNIEELGSRSFIIINLIRYSIVLTFMIGLLCIHTLHQTQHKLPQNSINEQSMGKSSELENIKPTNQKIRLLKYLIAIVLLGSLLGDFLYSETIRLMDATFVSIIGMTLPLFSIPLNYLVNKEKISRKFIPGILVTLLGVTVLILGI